MKNKIKEISELKNIVKNHQRQDKKVVFTNGCFDLLHIGHIRYLYRAKEFGSILVVALNSDKSVKSLKGEKRPIINEKERAEILAALEMIDYITIFDDLTCKNILKTLKPDIYVKGGDYTRQTLPEWPVVTNYGGNVKLVKEIEGQSTTSLIGKIAKIYDDNE
ncbi:MAG TPA: D-glycero-beta-D-manno-heptose 1-phosphate adenylyltransferase [Halanaerobiales bacterium]|nr:D-glycero-beta-D-manno-heptose 1-phosphate adenylyltransferase [Halanaerobiales bacterium]